jgi:hypothetical protein
MAFANLLERLPARASHPSADALFQLGLRLSTPGEGAANDPIAAVALFELAARLGSIEAMVYRRELSDEMDPADIAEAHEIARRWLADS